MTDSRTDKKALWRCPNCGRQFRTTNQSHSCVRYTADSHFEGKPPELREAYEFLIANLQRFRSIRVVAVKSSINIAGQSNFAAVYVRKDSLNLEFVLDRDLADERIVRTQPLGKKLRSYFVKVQRAANVDAQVLKWLKEAYALKR